MMMMSVDLWVQENPTSQSKSSKHVVCRHIHDQSDTVVEESWPTQTVSDRLQRLPLSMPRLRHSKKSYKGRSEYEPPTLRSGINTCTILVDSTQKRLLEGGGGEIQVFSQIKSGHSPQYFAQIQTTSLHLMQISIPPPPEFGKNSDHLPSSTCSTSLIIHSFVTNQPAPSMILSQIDLIANRPAPSMILSQISMPLNDFVANRHAPP